MKEQRRICTAVITLLVLWAGASFAADPGIPKLVDLGATKCMACKKMAPILEQLAKDYAGVLDVEFIDVWKKKNVKKAERYGIEQIPTQVFLNAEGKELWRHVGFISREDILEKWEELGYPLRTEGEADN